MAKNNSDDGFEEVPLDHDFEEVPLSDEDKATVGAYLDKPEMSLGESALAGLGQGGTMGLGNRIGSAVGATASALAQDYPQITKEALAPEKTFEEGQVNSLKQPQSIDDLYNEYLEYNNRRLAKAHKDHPAAYNIAEFGGALASPLNAIGVIGKLKKEAPLVTKIGHGIVNGTTIGALGGAAQSPDLTDLPDVGSHTLTGMEWGAGIGGGVPLGIGAAKGAAKFAANLAKPLIGPAGSMGSKGLKAGFANKLNLDSEAGQTSAVQKGKDFAGTYVNYVVDNTKGSAADKVKLLDGAFEKGQVAKKDALDAINQKYLEIDPNDINGEKARQELNQMKEMIIESIEGPKIKQFIRLENPERTRRPMPSSKPQLEMDNRSNLPIDDTIPINQEIVGDITEPNISATQVSNESVPFGMDKTKTNIPIAAEESAVVQEAVPTKVSSADSPSGFEGYEPVHQSTIEDTIEARNKFKHKVAEKQANEELLAKNTNSSEIEYVEKKLPNGQVRMVARRPIIKEALDDFAEQAEALAQKQKEADRLQSLLDKQQEDQIKWKQMQEKDLAQNPEYVEYYQDVRAGGRNQADPAELYKLSKNLNEQGQFAQGRGFSSQEMNHLAGQAAKDYQSLIKMTVPETVPMDERIHAFNNIAERLGIDADALKIPGGTGAKARADAAEKILQTMTPEAPTVKSQFNKDTVMYMIDQLKKIDPAKAVEFEKQAQEYIGNMETISQLKNPGTVGGGGPILSSMRRGLSKTAYSTGYAIGKEGAKMQPMVDSAKKAFHQYTPEALKSAGNKAMGSSNKTIQQIGQVLVNLADKDDRTRNSVLFVLQQQAGYRQLMAPYLGPQEEGTPQAKDNGQQK